MEKYITSKKLFYHGENIHKWLQDKDVNPVTVELHLSNKCNNKCYYCGSHGKDNHVMGYREALQSIDFIAEIGAKAVVFTGGGEPTLHENLPEILLYCAFKGLDAGLITNGVTIPVNMLQHLTTLKWLRVSIDAINADNYKRIRGVNQFDAVVNNLQTYLCDRPMRTTIGCQVVVNKYNYDKISKICTAYNVLFPGLDYIHVRPIEIKIDEHPYSETELFRIFSELSKIKESNVIISDKWDLFKEKRSFGFHNCHAANFIGVIDAHGDFYLCCHHIKNKNYKFLNIFKDEKKFFEQRKKFFRENKSFGFNEKICPVACRGSQINISCEKLLLEDHINFL